MQIVIFLDILVVWNLLFNPRLRNFKTIIKNGAKFTKAKNNCTRNLLFYLNQVKSSQFKHPQRIDKTT